MAIAKTFMDILVHYIAMMRKNFLVSIRSPKGTVGQLITPILFMAILILAQKLPASFDQDPPVESLPRIPECQGGEEPRCFSLLYTLDIPSNPVPCDPWNCPIVNSTNMDEIMQIVATKNDFEISTTFDPEATDGNRKIYKVATPQILRQFILDHPNVTQSAIVFSPENQGWGNSASYAIQYNSTAGTRLPPHLFASVLRALDEGIITIFGRLLGLPEAVNGKIANIEIGERKFPEISGASFDAIQNFGNLLFYCALMFNWVIFLYNIVNEKQLNLRQGMRMIGLSDVAYWFSWFSTNMLFLLLYIILIFILGYSGGFAFFMRTHPMIIFFNFFTFGLAMTPLAILIGMFLSSTRQAINLGMVFFVIGTVAQIVFTIPFIIIVLYYEELAPPGIRIGFQFYPPYNFSKIMYNILAKSNELEASKLEDGDNSLLFPWDEQYKSVKYPEFEVPGAAESFGYQMMCCAIFSVLAWYSYNVLPSEKGLPPWFMFTKSYWNLCGTAEETTLKNEASEAQTDDDDVADEWKSAMEGDADLRIVNLHKKFTKYGVVTTVYAVRGLSLAVERGQVFALLGHNGAGKTTSINVLTGLTRPTAGDALIRGLSLKKNMASIRQMVGICPQHNILWDELTPEEHLRIFADIKRVPRSEQKAMIKERLEDVLLYDVKNKHSGKFSGGMKRRLSVAIAVMGDPAIVYLDEPTTGLDPMSRREIWGAIQKIKKGRVVVLTTHSMEEADVLGDRIGVMAHGRLKCIGTGLHLKNKFGLGYRLNLSTDAERQEELQSLVETQLAGIQLIAATGGNLIYGVTNEKLPLLVPFFQFIEQSSSDPKFLIKDWGMSQTTLEEVFLKVTRDDAHNSSFV